MFCTTCGKQIADSAKFCEFCGNPVISQAEPQQPVFTPPVQEPVQPTFTPPVEQPVQQTDTPPVEQPAFQLTTPAQPKKKKGKGGKIALAVIALVLVVGIVLAAFNWNSVVRFFNRNFAEPQVYLADVEKDNVSDVAKDVATAYDEALATYSSKGSAVDATVTVQVGDQLISLLSTALIQSGMDLDLSWVENIVLEPKVNTYENTMQVDLGVGLNSTRIATVSMVWDMDSQTIWVGVPELHKTFIEIDATEAMGYEAEEMAEAIAMSQQMTAQLMEALPSGEQLEELINTYFGIVLDGISDVEKSTETMEAGDLEQKLTVLTAQLSQKDILKIASNVLEEAKDDSIIEDIMDNLSQQAGTDLYEAFSYSVDDMLEELDYAIDEAEGGKFLTIETYLDNKDDIAGRAFTVHMDGQKVKAHYITVTQGKEFAFEAELATVSITGKGTINGDKRTGSYTLTESGTDYVTVEIEDFLCTDDGQVTGTIRVIPESAVYEMMDLDASVAGILGQAALELTLGEDSLTLGIETGNSNLLSVSLSGQTTSPSQISLPDGISTDDNAGGQKWLSELDFDTVLNNLEKAGVPGDYMTAIEQLVDLLASELG